MRKHGFTLTKLHASHSSYQIEGTELFVARFEHKKYGMPPEWDVTERNRADWPLVTGKSLDDALYRLATIRDHLGVATPTRCPVKGAACGLYAKTVLEPEDDGD